VKNKYYLLLVLSLSLIACTDGILFGSANSNNLASSITIESNAFAIVIRDGPNAEWNPIVTDNNAFDPRTLSYIVKDPQNRIAVGILCPSIRETQPHRVHFFYASVVEIRELEYNCLRDINIIDRENAWGKVAGIDTAASELAYITVATDNSVQAYETYATTRPIDSGDILAYKGVTNKQGELQLAKFFRSSLASPAKSDLSRQDINFECASPRTDSCLISSAVTSDRANVTIENPPLGANWTSKAGFYSKLKTYMLLTTENNATSFAYQGLPQLIVEDKSKTFVTVGEEGHEVITQTFDENKLVTSQVVSLNSIATDVTQSIPTIPDSVASIGLKANGNISDLNITWPSYSDSSLGDASLFRWKLSGTPGTWEKKQDTDPDIKKIEWLVAVSPNWFVANETNTLNLVAPKNISGWRDDLGFDADKPINWELSYLAGHKKIVELLEYIDRRSFVNGLTYSQAVQRATVNP